MTQPRVTVLMSVYNAERFVADAVESVINQTFLDFEFLIFEDKSTDASLSVLRSYEDSRIRLMENAENLGLTQNLVLGVNMARGEYVARMDADDVCLPHRLATQVAYMDAHPEIGVLGSAVTFFSESGKKFVAHQPLGHEEIKCALFYGFTMLHPSVMIRKMEFDRHGLNYDPAFRVSQDHDLWTRAIRKVGFANLYEPLVRMREHEGKIGNTRKPLQLKLSNLVRKRQFEELGLAVTAQEIKIFSEPQIGAAEWNIEDLKEFEVLLLRIFAANKVTLVFDQDILIRLGVVYFRGVCRQLLIDGNRSGRYYWRSKFRHIDNLSFRQIVSFSFRSLRTLFISKKPTKIARFEMRTLIRNWIVGKLNSSKFYWKYIRRSHIEDAYWALRAPQVSSYYKKMRAIEETFYTELFLKYNVSKVFDIGGNNGDKTDIFLACGAQHVVLVEPDPYWSEIHQWRFEKNNSVQICPVAVSSTSGQALLQRFSPGCPLNSLEIKWVETLAGDNGRFQRQSVTDTAETMTVTFDQLVKQYGSPDYAKIDVEGHESHVLLGMQKIPRLISLEFNLPEFEVELRQSIEILEEIKPKCLMNFVVEYENSFELMEWLKPAKLLEELQARNLRYIELFVQGEC